MPETTTDTAQQAAVSVRGRNQPLARVRRLPWPTLAVVAAGGAIGATARFGLATAFPHGADAFAWATFGTNVSGCLLIGALMVLVTEVWPGHRLLRPFLGVGVLGGFTTFSTYVVEAQQALAAGAPRLALAYLGGTLLAALVAVFAGSAATRWQVKALRRKDIP